MASPSVTQVTRREAANYPTAIQQSITSGGNFDGTLPQAAGPVRANSPLGSGNSIYKYAPANKGGLFFWANTEALICTQINIDLGASGNVSVRLCNLNPATINDDAPTTIAGEDVLIEQATAVTFLALNESKFRTIILPYQAIKIVTTATAAAQIAQVVAALERTMVR
jgi:hypothetical protein